MTANSSRTGRWMAAGFLGALALAAAALGHWGTGKAGTLTALQMSARWAYGFFWFAYVGGALAALWGPRFQPLARRGRELGLAFAAAMVVHVAMIVRIYAISSTPPIPLANAIYFGVGLAFAYAMAALSFPRFGAWLSPRARRVFFTVGLEYIALAFLRDFLRDPFSGSVEHLIGYLPFIALGLTGTLLRLLVYAQRLRRAFAAEREVRTVGTVGAAAGDAKRRSPVT